MEKNKDNIYCSTKSSDEAMILLEDGWEIYGYELSYNGVEIELKRSIHVNC